MFVGNVLASLTTGDVNAVAASEAKVMVVGLVTTLT